LRAPLPDEPQEPTSNELENTAVDLDGDSRPEKFTIFYINSNKTINVWLSARGFAGAVRVDNMLGEERFALPPCKSGPNKNDGVKDLMCPEYVYVTKIIPCPGRPDHRCGTPNQVLQFRTWRYERGRFSELAPGGRGLQYVPGLGPVLQ
jgi:hypothetical protein